MMKYLSPRLRWLDAPWSGQAALSCPFFKGFDHQVMDLHFEALGNGILPQLVLA
jgi:hypothetical protein